MAIGFESIRILTIKMTGVITPVIIREITAAFRSLGADAALLEDFSTYDELRNGVLEHNPDFVFTIDYVASRDRPDFFTQMNVPHVTWFVDTPANVTVANEGDIFFASDEYWLEHIRRTGGKHTHHLPLCTNPNVFHPVGEESKLSPFRSDVSFLGSTMHSDEMDVLMSAPNVNDAMKRAFNAIVRRRVERPDEEFKKIVAHSAPEFEGLFSNPASEQLKLLLLQQAAQDIRAGYISALGAGVHVYGDEKWNSLASTGINIHPGLDPVAEAPLLYQASRINLNFSAGQLETALNQRIFDIGACGGFVLTDYRSDLKRLFDFKSETACFHSLSEMKEKIVYYLDNEDARNAVSEKARKRVLAEHTYENRAEKILRTFISVYRK